MFLGFLKKSIWFFLLILFAFGVFWYFLFFRKPCTSPIQYKIASFDNRFGISKTDFLNDISIAEKIWEKPIGKVLFEYNPKGDLSINLVYDSRQKITQQNAVLQTDINKINTLATNIKNQYLSLEAEYNKQEQAYKEELAQFNQKQASYISEVDYWNSRGGAPKAEYNKLIVEKNELLDMQNILETKRISINTLVDQINTFIQKYNLLIRDANSNIKTINQTAGKEFEEGQYDPNKNEINIYEFSSNQKLVRVLSHELGHALGLEHNENPDSIMYALNQSNTEKLSSEDLQGLKTKCQLE